MAAPSSDYRIYQAPGAWTAPYPDLNIAYHTGISIGAHYSYGGTRFFNNSDMATEIFSVGNGDNNVRVTNDLYLGTSGRWLSTFIHPGNIASQSVSHAETADSADKVDGINIGTVTSGQWCTGANGTTISCTTAAPNSMVYPGAGIPSSTGSAWGGSYATTGSGNVVLSSAPTVSDIYNSAWFRNKNALTGLYNEATGVHFYSDTSAGWVLTGGNNYPRLEFKDTYQSTVRGSVYSDASGFGLLNSAGGWGFMLKPGSTEVYMPGKVGIGIATPSNKLEVAGGGISVTGGYTSPGGSAITLSQESAYGQLQTWGSKPLYINPLGNNVILNNSGGYVGIGKTPTHPLDVSGEIYSSTQVSAPTVCISGICKSAWPTLPASSDSYDADATFNSVTALNLTASGSVRSNGTLNVTGATTLASLNVSGATTMNTLNVTSIQSPNIHGGVISAVDSLDVEQPGTDSFAALQYRSNAAGATLYIERESSHAVAFDIALDNVEFNKIMSFRTNTQKVSIGTDVIPSTDALLIVGKDTNNKSIKATGMVTANILRLDSINAGPGDGGAPSCVSGAIYYSSASSHFYGCVVSTWKQLD